MRRDFSVIPAKAGIYTLRFFRHSGEGRNLYATIFPSFRRRPESIRYDFSVIPAKAGIYARSHLKRNAAVFVPFPSKAAQWQGSAI